MRSRFGSRLAACGVWVGLSVAWAGAATTADWTGFRGPRGLGTAEAQNLPVVWDSNKNIVWKRDLPGLGSSSPIICAGKVFLTCYSGYAESAESPGAMERLVRHVVCLDRKTGEILWTKPFQAKMPESKYGSKAYVSRHGYASGTPATDGERLYVFFGASGVYCLDYDGNLLWNVSVGNKTHDWGSGASPVLYKHLVIINASVESGSLIALDKMTGQEVWRAPGVSSCWGSPHLVDVKGKQELVLNIPKKLTAFDPETGERLWYCDGIPDGYLCPTPIAHEDVVFAIGARKGAAMAVRAGGRGDVTGSHVLWTADKGSNVSSPVYLDGRLYWFHASQGVAYCLNAETGALLYEQRLSPSSGIIYSSATAADGKLYVASQDKGVYVLAATPQFQLLAVNVFQDDKTRTNASIAVSDNQLIMRTDKAIYCIGQ
jgi:outer membrane protein assembly factor BamB